MNSTLKVRGLEIGSGAPKTCVCLTGTAQNEILLQAALAVNSAADMVEWRADYFAQNSDDAKIVETLHKIRHEIGEKPLVFTMRTRLEGGASSGIDTTEHCRGNMAAIKSNAADFIDVEYISGKTVCKKLVDSAKQNGVFVFVSSSDFVGTPAKADILLRLHMLVNMGADIPRFSAMAKTPEDLLNLLGATSEFAQKHSSGPLATVSLGKTGNLTRVVGEYFGNSISFAFLDENTPPGQLSLNKLKPILDVLHDSRQT